MRAGTHWEVSLSNGKGAVSLKPETGKGRVGGMREGRDKDQRNHEEVAQRSFRSAWAVQKARKKRTPMAAYRLALEKRGDTRNKLKKKKKKNRKKLEHKKTRRRKLDTGRGVRVIKKGPGNAIPFNIPRGKGDVRTQTRLVERQRGTNSRGFSLKCKCQRRFCGSRSPNTTVSC